VVQRQPEDIQNFLLPDLRPKQNVRAFVRCVDRWRSRADILDHLDRANLFIVPLDNRRGWYRYHTIFANLLQQRLNKHLQPKEIMLLRRKASAWYEQAEMPEEAITLALAAQDYEFSADLIRKEMS